MNWAIRGEHKHPGMYLYNLCKTFNCMPEPGGVLDQDAWWMDFFNECIKAESEKIETEGNRKKFEMEAKNRGRG